MKTIPRLKFVVMDFVKSTLKKIVSKLKFHKKWSGFSTASKSPFLLHLKIMRSELQRVPAFRKKKKKKLAHFEVTRERNVFPD